MTCLSDLVACRSAVSPQHPFKNHRESNKGLQWILLVVKMPAARSPSIPLRCGSAVVCILVPLALALGPAFAATQPPPGKQQSKDVSKSVKRLWSQYPLDPRTSAGGPGPSQESNRAELRSTGASRSEGNDDSANTTTSLLLAVAIAALGSLAIVALILSHGPVSPGAALRGMPRRRLALPRFALASPSPSRGLGVHLRPEGGQLMSYFRRRRDSGSDDDNGAPTESHEPSIGRFTPYSLAASGDASTGPPDRPDAEPRVEGREPTDPVHNDPASYEQVGEHVTAVLSSAHEAAERLQASATKEAEQVRVEAEDYALKTRSAADDYAEEHRQSAQTEASAITGEAEQKAREVRDAAERDATEIQRDAVRRRESLLQEAERSEERLRDLLKVFRAMTDRLENLVEAPVQAAPTTGAERDAAVEDDLPEALIAQSRSSDS
jgi:hypothetical protein